MGGYDLHTHTFFSDGTTSPEDNIRRALEIGLDGIGVTDHDTTEGWERALAAAEGTDLEVVPGAELSAELDGWSVHVLGYWFDPRHPELAAEMVRLREERDRRAIEIVERFVDLGIPITMERVRELAGRAPVGRPHLATAVVETGAAGSVSEVFDRWLHDGGPAYVAKYAVDPVRCVELVVAAGGVTVLAHPGLYGPPEEPGIDPETIADMTTAGLAGIEADHPDHAPAQRRHFRDVAAAHDLVVTAGSDYHGDRKDLDLGQSTTSVTAVEELRARCVSCPSR
jgi:3',5'-nucleoside bisphosphate phosphatase